MRITIITDNQNSWFIPFGKMLQDLLIKRKHNVAYVFHKDQIPSGDVCFILSCLGLIDKNHLDRNTNNIVVHASDLPKGKGFAPMQWQILEGKNEIPLTLFEAVEEFDAGPYYIKTSIPLNGTELYEELRAILGRKIVELCLEYIDNYGSFEPKDQTGSSSFYPRRSTKDDEINPDKSIKELFNHFRVADNKQHPLYFYYKDRKYILKIEEEK